MLEHLETESNVPGEIGACRFNLIEDWLPKKGAPHLGLTDAVSAGRNLSYIVRSFQAISALVAKLS